MTVGPDYESADGGATAASDERAVSETVGFVLVFALITTTIAVTFTVGLGGLEDAQVAERDANVERAFDVLHDNLRDVSREGVPSRATEIRIAGGELALAERTTIRIIDAEGNATVVERTRPIVYRGSGDTEIVYENGAVFRSSGDVAVPLNDPDLVINGDPGDRTVMYSLVRTTGQPQAVAGDRTTLVVGSTVSRELVEPDREPNENVTPENKNVTLEIDSPRADGWERHYERLAAADDEVNLDPDGDGDVTVDFELEDGDEFLIHRTTIDVEFSD